MFLSSRRTSVVVLVYAFLIKDSKPLPAAGPQMEKNFMTKKKKKLSYCAFCPLGQISLESCLNSKISSSRCFEARFLSVTSFHPASTKTRRRPAAQPPACIRSRQKRKKKEEKIHNHSPDNDDKNLPV